MSATRTRSSGAGAGKETILVLVDEIGRDGLPRRSRNLVEALETRVAPVLVAQRYRKPLWSGKGLPRKRELYAFPAEGYNASVKSFAKDLVARHAPKWILAYGWENTQLIVECHELGIPIMIVIDHVSKNPSAEQQITWSSSFADMVLFSSYDLLPSMFPWQADEIVASDFLSDRFRLLEPIEFDEARPSSFRATLSHRKKIYGDFVDALMVAGRDAVRRHARGEAQMALDETCIMSAQALNTLMFRSMTGSDEDPRAALRIYLRASHDTIPRARHYAGRILRRPLEGFHPLIYATDNPAFDDEGGEDPLAHYLRHGRPGGRWTHEIIREVPEAEPAVGQRVAIHAHVHYPDLLPELLDRLRINRSRGDLLVTTTSDARRDEIAETLAGAGIAPACLTSEPSNRGRDIWPFLRLLRSGAFEGYDVVGHVHGKRSPTYEHGNRWREFLWRHLVGGPERMMDAILSHFERDERLGLVIAEDPGLVSWAENMPIASELAAKMDLPLPLPTHFEFPVGTMFWARPRALLPMLDLDLTEEMIPPEPLPQDGTLLHALERLIPFAVGKAGYGLAATYVPGCTW